MAIFHFKIKIPFIRNHLTILLDTFLTVRARESHERECLHKLIRELQTQRKNFPIAHAF